jgi:hypothetical protein
MVRDLIEETPICEDGALPVYINKDMNSEAFNFRSVYPNSIDVYFFVTN